MPSPDPPLGYLRRVLRDGVRPYLYRSRVRRLLGLPENGPEVAYGAAHGVPAGFRYLAQPGGPTLGPATRALRDRPPAPGERRQGAGVSEAAADAGGPATPVGDPIHPARRKQIEVPGVSEPRRHFAALAGAPSIEPEPASAEPASTEPASVPGPPPSPREARSGPATETRRFARPGLSGTGGERLQDGSPAPLEKAHPKIHSIVAPADPAPAPGREPPGPLVPGPRPPVPAPGSINERPIAGAAPASSGPASGAALPGPTSGARPRPPVPAPRATSELAPASLPAAPSGGVFPVPTRARDGARSPAAALARVRRAVSRPASRPSPPATDQEPSGPRAPRPAAAAPPPAPVVVVRAPASPPTPDAFWERSYLGHSLLRTGR